MFFRVSDRVTRVIYRTYAVDVQTDRLLSIMAYFACGSMVRFCLFPPCRRRIGPVVQADAWVWHRPRNACYL